LNQLRTLAKSTAPQPSAPAPAPAAPQQWQQYPAPPPTQPSFPANVPKSFLHATQATPLYPAEHVKVDPSIAPAAPLSMPVFPPTMNAQTPADLTNLLSTLLKAGVVSATGTPVGAGSTAKEEASKQQVESVNLEREASRAYRQVILSQPVKLSSSDITRHVDYRTISCGSPLWSNQSRTRPQIVELLYDRLSAQCKQCGIRFADTIVGKKNMEDHLDMHFRQNRKASQNVGRGHSRSWFIGVEVCFSCHINIFNC
jgi:pre-mRNA cleavage complex 2 protein Pcf11